MEANGTILEIGGLKAGFNGREVLRGVDLRIGKDESIALIGPNGCGKSTLLARDGEERFRTWHFGIQPQVIRWPDPEKGQQQLGKPILKFSFETLPFWP